MKQNVIIAYDPGNEQTGWVVSLEDNSKLIYKNKDLNTICFEKTKEFVKKYNVVKVGCEYPSSYGMAVNQTLLDTCTFCGILGYFFKNNNIPFELIFRKSVKMFLCGSVRAKDAEVNTRVREYVGEDYTIKTPNLWYWNEEVEANGGNRYCNGDMYAAIAVLLYMIYPHDILIQDEKEQEHNKIAKELQLLLNL